MTWEQDAAAAIRGLKAENERLREENNVLSAREARAENSALHLGALVDELRARLAGSADLAARLAEAHASLAEGDKRYAAENARLQARLAEAEEVLDSFGACPNPGNCRNCADKLAAYVSKREGPWFNPWTGKMSDGTTVTVPVAPEAK